MFYRIAVTVAFLGAAVFAIGYGVVDWKTRWYRYALSQQIVADQIVIAVILGTTLARVWFHEIPTWIGILEFVALPIVIWWRTIFWLRVRRRNKK